MGVMSKLKSESDYAPTTSDDDSSDDEYILKNNKKTKEGYEINNFVVEDNKKRKLDEYDDDEYYEDELAILSKKNPLIKKIKTEINNKKITLKKIADSNLSLKEKVDLTERYLILQTIPDRSFEYNELRDYINSKLGSNSKLTKDELEIEEELKKINKTNISMKERILKSRFNNKIKALIYRRYE